MAQQHTTDHRQQQRLDEHEWLQRRRKISVRKAAALADVSEDSFRRHYGHLIRQITPRRQGVELGDALDLPPPTPTPLTQTK